MNRWEIWKADLPGLNEPHYFVLISPQGFFGDFRENAVNGLVCNTRRPVSDKKDFHAVLTETDGMDRTTLVTCNFVFQIPKKVLIERKGLVGIERRRDIARRLSIIFALV